MKQIVEKILKQALQTAIEAGSLPSLVANTDLGISHAKDSTHGDYASNLALVLASACKMAPRSIAELLVKTMSTDERLERVEIAGPGFINFFMRLAKRADIVADVLSQTGQFGQSDLGRGRRVLLEYVSANPTGPLHVGHGRSAAFGASLANLLRLAGFDVHREYYVNDAGRQMDILAVSAWLRYLSLAGVPIIFPANAYRGDYVELIAGELHQAEPIKYIKDWSVISEGLPLDEPEGGDKDIYIDALIARAKTLLHIDGFNWFHQQALNWVLDDIKDDLAGFGVVYDTWFSERTLLDDGSIAAGIEALTNAGHTYEHEGALWFRATAFGDEKDRVLIRSNGVNTYFASDVAYHWNKYHRGFERVIDIFGADHHGYVSRIKSAVNALGHNEGALDILLVQFAILYRDGARVQMSTRSGSFVTLRELRQEVGNDVARFFYVMRKPEQHMDFDLDLAKAESNDNPVYYVQYAHARICSVLRQLQQRGLSWDRTAGLTTLHLLDDPHELTLIALLNRYPDLIEVAASMHEPHQVAYYLRELANALHSYYNAVSLLCESEALRWSRLCLLEAVRQVLANALELLGVNAPESM